MIVLIREPGWKANPRALCGLACVERLDMAARTVTVRFGPWDGVLSREYTFTADAIVEVRDSKSLEALGIRTLEALRERDAGASTDRQFLDAMRSAEEATR